MSWTEELDAEKDPGQYVRTALAWIEFEFRAMAILALTTWAEIGVVDARVAVIAAQLKKPPWGRWNGLLDALRESRSDAVEKGVAREKLNEESPLRRLLDLRRESPPEEVARPLMKLLRRPRPKRVADLLALPINLRNRIAHAYASSPKEWAEAAEALRPLVRWFATVRPLDRVRGSVEWATPGFHMSEGLPYVYHALDASVAGGRLAYWRPDRGVVEAEPHISAWTLFIAKLCGRAPGATAEAPSMPVLLLGDFEVYDLVGEGAQGVVHRAMQVSTGRTVALKVFMSGDSDEEREESRVRFHREAEFLQECDHPHVVRVYAAGEDAGISVRDVAKPPRWFKDDRLFMHLALEWVDGKTLAAIFDGAKEGTSQRPSDSIVLEWFAQAAEAVTAMHLAGVVHRDLKPANMMVSSVGTLRVMDFGIARSQHRRHETVTRQGVPGTPAYMAPELLKESKDASDRPDEERRDVARAADQYALAQVFYELFMNRALFDHDRSPDEALVRKLSTDHPVPLDRPGAKLPWELRVVLESCLAHDRVNRYASVADLADDLRRIQRHEPIKKKRPSIVRRARLFYRRNKAVLNVLVAATCVLVVVTSYYLVSVTRETRRAVAAEGHARRNEEAARRRLAAQYRQGLVEALEARRGPQARMLAAASMEVGDEAANPIARGGYIEAARMTNLAEAWSLRAVEPCRRVVFGRGSHDLYCLASCGATAWNLDTNTEIGRTRHLVTDRTDTTGCSDGPMRLFSHRHDVTFELSGRNPSVVSADALNGHLLRVYPTVQHGLVNGFTGASEAHLGLDDLGLRGASSAVFLGAPDRVFLATIEGNAGVTELARGTAFSTVKAPPGITLTAADATGSALMMAGCRQGPAGCFSMREVCAPEPSGCWLASVLVEGSSARIVTLRDEPRTPLTLTLSGDHRRVLVLESDASVHTLSWPDLREISARPSGVRGATLMVSDRSLSTVAVASSGGDIVASDGAGRTRWSRTLPEGIRDLALSDDGAWLAVASQGGPLRRWRIEAAEGADAWELTNRRGTILGLDVTARGSLVATVGCSLWRRFGCEEGELGIYALSTGALVRSATTPGCRVSAVRFDEAGEALVTGDKCGRVQLWTASNSWRAPISTWGVDGPVLDVGFVRGNPTAVTIRDREEPTRIPMPPTTTHDQVRLEVVGPVSPATAAPGGNLWRHDLTDRRLLEIPVENGGTMRTRLDGVGHMLARVEQNTLRRVFLEEIGPVERRLPLQGDFDLVEPIPRRAAFVALENVPGPVQAAEPERQRSSTPWLCMVDEATDPHARCISLPVGERRYEALAARPSTAPEVMDFRTLGQFGGNRPHGSVALGRDDGVIDMVDVQTGVLLSRWDPPLLPNTRAEGVSALRFSEDGRYLVAGFANGTLRVFRHASSGGSVGVPQDTQISSVAVAGDTIYATIERESPSVEHGTGYARYYAERREHEIAGLAWNRLTGQQRLWTEEHAAVATAWDGGTVAWLNMPNGLQVMQRERVVQSLTALRDLPWTSMGLVLSPDGTHALLNGPSVPQLFDLEKPGEPTGLLAFAGSAEAGTFTRDGQSVVVAREGRIAVFDLHGRARGSWGRTQTGRISALVALDADTVFAASWSGLVKLRRRDGGEWQRETVFGPWSTVNAVIRLDSNHLAVSTAIDGARPETPFVERDTLRNVTDQRGEVVIVQLREGTVERVRAIIPCGRDCRSLAYDPVTQTLVADGGDDLIRWWDLSLLDADPHALEQDTERETRMQLRDGQVAAVPPTSAFVPSNPD